MEWISFDPFRTRGLPHTRHLKAEHFYQELDSVRAAEWVLFPEHWQVNALTFGLKARIFPGYASYQLGIDKIEMTRAFLSVKPDNVPETLIRANTDAIAEEVWDRMTLPFVAKLPKSAQGRGVWLIQDRADWRKYLSGTPVLYVQEYLPCDRDVRVVIVGDKVVTSYWRLQSANGFHNNVARGGFIDHKAVPAAAIELALSTARALDIDHAGFDIVMVGDRPYLLEFNRLFGNQGIAAATLQEHMLAWLLRHRPTHPDVTPPGVRRVA